MTPTTTLEAVNIMLSTVGESPVNSLSSGLVEAEMALTILQSTSKAVQAKGWTFNQELAVRYAPNSSKEIILPLNILRADATIGNKAENTDSQSLPWDLVQRGQKMYDRRNHTYLINKTVELDVVLQLPFEELPEVARRFVIIRAARVFQDRVVGSATLHGFQERDEQDAYFDLVEHEGDTGDYSIFDNASVSNILARN